jgi:hypothetical protein
LEVLLLVLLLLTSLLAAVLSPVAGGEEAREALLLLLLLPVLDITLGFTGSPSLLLTPDIKNRKKIKKPFNICSNFKYLF